MCSPFFVKCNQTHKGGFRLNKKLTFYSYGSFISSLFTMPFFYLLIYDFIPVNFRLGIVVMGVMILATFVLGIMACFKDGEKNYLAVISFIIGAVNLFVFGTGLLMSQMASA